MTTDYKGLFGEKAAAATPGAATSVGIITEDGSNATVKYTVEGNDVVMTAKNHTYITATIAEGGSYSGIDYEPNAQLVFELIEITNPGSSIVGKFAWRDTTHSDTATDTYYMALNDVETKAVFAAATYDMSDGVNTVTLSNVQYHVVTNDGEEVYDYEDAAVAGPLKTYLDSFADIDEFSTANEAMFDARVDGVLTIPGYALEQTAGTALTVNTVDVDTEAVFTVDSVNNTYTGSRFKDNAVGTIGEDDAFNLVTGDDTVEVQGYFGDDTVTVSKDETVNLNIKKYDDSSLTAGNLVKTIDKNGNAVLVANNEYVLTAVEKESGLTFTFRLAETADGVYQWVSENDPDIVLKNAEIVTNKAAFTTPSEEGYEFTYGDDDSIFFTKAAVTEYLVTGGSIDDSNKSVAYYSALSDADAANTKNGAYLADTCVGTITLQNYANVESQDDTGVVKVGATDLAGQSFKADFSDSTSAVKIATWLKLNDLIGSNYNDSISALGSSMDDIYAGKGNDTIYSEAGTDTVFTGEGNDVVNVKASNTSSLGPWVRNTGGDDTVNFVGIQNDDLSYNTQRGVDVILGDSEKGLGLAINVTDLNGTELLELTTDGDDAAVEQTGVADYVITYKASKGDTPATELKWGSKTFTDGETVAFLVEKYNSTQDEVGLGYTDGDYMLRSALGYEVDGKTYYVWIKTNKTTIDANDASAIDDAHVQLTLTNVKEYYNGELVKEDEVAVNFKDEFADAIDTGTSSKFAKVYAQSIDNGSITVADYAALSNVTGITNLFEYDNVSVANSTFTADLSTVGSTYVASELSEKIVASSKADTIIFAPASKDDVIVGANSSDALKFTETEMSALAFTRQGQDLKITGNGTSTIYVQGFYDEDSKLDTIYALKNGVSTKYSLLKDGSINVPLTGDTYAGTIYNEAIIASVADSTINGGAGKDLIVSNSGSNDLFGGDGNDTISAFGTLDAISGGAGDDSIIIGGGTAARINVTANQGVDTVEGADANDKITFTGINSTAITTDVNVAANTLTLKGGNTTVVVDGFIGSGFDSINAIKGDVQSDLSLAGEYGIYVDNNPAAASEKGVQLYVKDAVAAAGAKGNDLINAELSDHAVAITGGDGNDTIISSNYNDTITGGEGADSITVLGDGNKTINLDSGSDTLNAVLAEGDLTVNATLGDNVIYLGEGDDAINLANRTVVDPPATSNKIHFYEDGGADTIVNSNKADTLIFDEAKVSDMIFAKSATDSKDLIISYGNGDAVLVKGYYTAEGEVAKDALAAFQALNSKGKLTTYDLSKYTAKPAIDPTLIAAFDTKGLLPEDAVLYNNLDKHSETTAQSIQAASKDGNALIAGGTNNDTLVASANTNVISGGAGDDAIQGGSSTDVIYGDAGNDIIASGKGNDFIVGGLGNDLISLEGGNNRVVLGDGDGSDTLIGATANDKLDFTGETAPDADTDFARVAGSNDLVVTRNGGADSITIKDFFTAKSKLDTVVTGYNLVLEEDITYSIFDDTVINVTANPAAATVEYTGTDYNESITLAGTKDATLKMGKGSNVVKLDANSFAKDAVITLTSGETLTLDVDNLVVGGFAPTFTYNVADNKKDVILTLKGQDGSITLKDYAKGGTGAVVKVTDSSTLLPAVYEFYDLFAEFQKGVADIDSNGKIKGGDTSESFQLATYVSPDGNKGVSLTSGGGDDLVVGSAYNDTISIKSGDNTITELNGVNKVTTGSGDDTLIIGDIFGATPSYGSVSANLKDGDNTVTVEDHNLGTNKITLGKGDDTVYLGNGVNTVKVSSGTNNYTLAGGVNTITAGKSEDNFGIIGGQNTIKATASKDASFIVANGINKITTGKYADEFAITDGNNTIKSGNGVDEFFISGGQNKITAGNGGKKDGEKQGNEFTITGDSLNTITSGTGADVFTFKTAGAMGTYNGGKGNDKYDVDIAAAGTTYLKGGAGTDTYDFEDLAALASYNNIIVSDTSGTNKIVLDEATYGVNGLDFNVYVDFKLNKKGKASVGKSITLSDGDTDLGDASNAGLKVSYNGKNTSKVTVGDSTYTVNKSVVNKIASDVASWMNGYNKSQGTDFDSTSDIWTNGSAADKSALAQAFVDANDKYFA